MSGPPTPRHSVPSTQHRIQSRSGAMSLTSANGSPSYSVSSSSMVTVQPGLSSVPILGPYPCSQSPSHCASYHSWRRRSSSIRRCVWPPNAELSCGDHGSGRRDMEHSAPIVGAQLDAGCSGSCSAPLASASEGACPYALARRQAARRGPYSSLSSASVAIGTPPRSRSPDRRARRPR